MRRESAPIAAGSAAAPLALRFADLFDHLGTMDLRYSAAARALSGSEVVIEGYLSRSHGLEPALSLVDQPGVCPDCSPAVATIALTGARMPLQEGQDGAVRVTGRLDYGFRIDAGVASFLRIEAALVEAIPFPLVPAKAGTPKSARRLDARLRGHERRSAARKP